jgi:hypothetical protein
MISIEAFADLCLSDESDTRKCRRLMVIEVIKPYTVKLTRVFRFDYHRGSNSLRIHKEPELMRKSCIALITLWSIFALAHVAASAGKAVETRSGALCR